MTRDEARILLKLDSAKVSLTPEIVQTAFRRAVIQYHPDTAAQSGVPPEKFYVSVYQQAKNILLAQLSGADFACKLCNGLGMVASKMGYRACVACNGSGDKR